MQYVTLGKTGLRISRVGFGGIPIQRITQEECTKLFDEVVAAGINYIDTARGYTVSEQFIGQALCGRRDQFVLATKSMARTREAMEKDIEISLANLQTDYIDLYQIHNCPPNQLEQVCSEDGALAALKEAKPILEDSGVIIMIEPLNTLVNHKGYYLWSSVEAFDIIREVEHPLVKVVYDIYHQQVMEGNIIPNIVNNLDCIAHLHSAGHPGRHELQFGENDYNFIFDAVDKAGYPGACGLEYGPTLPPRESLRLAREKYGKK